jgi:hypothetical protein
MNDHDLLARLAAANPVPSDTPLRLPAPLPLRRLAVALAAAAAVTIPTVAFADDIGALLGLSNQGTPVATSSLDLSKATGLDEAMQELGFPSTLQLLGTRDGVSFYAARRADGHDCFAIESDSGKGVSCDITGTFPSAARPVFAFPPLLRFAGFAADGVATVAGVDGSGRTVVSAPVADNLFAAEGATDGVVVLEALDAHGNVIWTWRLPGR